MSLDTALSSAGAAASSSRRTFASGIVQDDQTQSRSIPQSRRADGTLRKERKVKPGYTPAEDIARYRSKRLMEEDARRASNSVPGSSSWAAAAASSSSGNSSGKYSSQLIGLKPPASAKEKEASVIRNGSAKDPTRPKGEKESKDQPTADSPSSLSSPELTKTSSGQTSSSVSTPPASSVSTPSRAPPTGLFARAMGGVAMQERARVERRASPAPTKLAPQQGSAGRADMVHSFREDGKRIPRGGRRGEYGQDVRSPPSRRMQPRPSASASDAGSWRRRDPPAPSAALSKSRSDQVDPIDDLAKGLQDLKVEKEKGDHKT